MIDANELDGEIFANIPADVWINGLVFGHFQSVNAQLFTKVAQSCFRWIQMQWVALGGDIYE